MTLGDLSILEFFDTTEIAATPKVVAYNTGYSDGYVRRRMPKLVTAGLLEYDDPDEAMYRLTETGREYLAGNVPACELEDALDADDD